jgi:hypothetical protein
MTDFNSLEYIQFELNGKSYSYARDEIINGVQVPGDGGTSSYIDERIQVNKPKDQSDTNFSYRVSKEEMLDIFLADPSSFKGITNQEIAKIKGRLLKIYDSEYGNTQITNRAAFFRDKV